MRFTEIISEAGSPAQQAAIAIAMKKAGKKPKNEGVNDTVYPNAEVIKSKNGKSVGEIYQDENGWGCLHYGADYGADCMDSREEALESLKDLAVENRQDHEEERQRIANRRGQGVEEGESIILSPGTEVTVPHKGKMVPGKIVRYDSGKGIESPAYIVDISEYESLIVPVSRVKQDMDEGETWAKHNNPRAGGMSKKSVNSYRRSHSGSKIQTAVTTKPSKLKKGSKAAKRRASFCARMRGMKKHRTSAKTAHDPNSNINKSLRRWHCESIEELHELVMLAEQFIRNKKNEL